MDERFEVGDHVRIVNYLRDGKMPVGIVENIDGAYIWVDCNIDGKQHQYKGHHELYPNELVKITEQEYFKLILSGTNADSNG